LKRVSAASAPKPAAKRTPYQCARDFHLFELLQVRATVRIGTRSTANARKERKRIIRDMAKLRADNGLSSDDAINSAKGK
jgi:hypothetical protein